MGFGRRKERGAVGQFPPFPLEKQKPKKSKPKQSEGQNETGK